MAFVSSTKHEARSSAKGKKWERFRRIEEIGEDIYIQSI